MSSESVLMHIHQISAVLLLVDVPRFELGASTMPR